jgi:hypothetical protein
MQTNCRVRVSIVYFSSNGKCKMVTRVEVGKLFRDMCGRERPTAYRREWTTCPVAAAKITISPPMKRGFAEPSRRLGNITKSKDCYTMGRTLAASKRIHRLIAAGHETWKAPDDTAGVADVGPTPRTIVTVGLSLDPMLKPAYRQHYFACLLGSPQNPVPVLQYEVDISLPEAFHGAAEHRPAGGRFMAGPFRWLQYRLLPFRQVLLWPASRGNDCDSPGSHNKDALLPEALAVLLGPPLDGRSRLFTLVGTAAEEKRRNTDETRQIIRRACRGRFLAAMQVAALIGRDRNKPLERFLTPMVKEGLLEMQYPREPKLPHHERQVRSRDDRRPSWPRSRRRYNCRRPGCRARSPTFVAIKPAAASLRLRAELRRDTPASSVQFNLHGPAIRRPNSSPPFIDPTRVYIVVYIMNYCLLDPVVYT